MFDYDTSTGEIFLYDEIGPEWAGMIDGGMMINALRDMGGRSVLVRINSPGGYVDDGVAIVNALRRYKGAVDTVVDSLAASMASQIMLVGETRRIAENAKVMIHSVRGLAYGTAEDFRKTANQLDKYEESGIKHYAEIMEIEDDEVKHLLEEETWYTGQEAVAAKLATDLDDFSSVEAPKVAANRYKNTPKDLIDQGLRVAAVSIRVQEAPVHRIKAEGSRQQIASRIQQLCRKQ